MTTATKTRPRKTKKKASKKTSKKKVRAKTDRKVGKTKKPKWSLVTFKQIEGWRTKLKLSKAGMAEALGVTNSTYHNWRRGTTIPHVNQQEGILQRLEALEKNATVAKGSGRPMGRPSTKGKAPRNGGVRNRLEDYNLNGDGSNGAGPAHPDRLSSGTLIGQDKVLRPDIAAITVAFIQSQKKPVSAGSIYKFVEGLHQVM